MYIPAAATSLNMKVSLPALNDSYVTNVLELALEARFKKSKSAKVMAKVASDFDYMYTSFEAPLKEWQSEVEALRSEVDEYEAYIASIQSMPTITYSSPQVTSENINSNLVLKNKFLTDRCIKLAEANAILDGQINKAAIEYKKLDIYVSNIMQENSSLYEENMFLKNQLNKLEFKLENVYQELRSQVDNAVKNMEERFANKDTLDKKESTINNLVDLKDHPEASNIVSVADFFKEDSGDFQEIQSSSNSEETDPSSTDSDQDPAYLKACKDFENERSPITDEDAAEVSEGDPGKEGVSSKK
jgi:hypothetical protein